MVLRYKLRKFDIPIDDSFKVCVDKKSVVTNFKNPELTLQKQQHAVN